MISVIPTDWSVSSVYSQTVTLDGVDYVLRLRWNERSGRWFFRLSDTAGAVIIGDTAVTADAPLFLHRVVPNAPPGELWCVTTSGDDPGLTDLGDGAQLVYVSESSLPSEETTTTAGDILLVEWLL